MILTTTNSIEGFKIADYLGIVTGVAIDFNKISLTHGSGSREDISIPFTSSSTAKYASFDLTIADLGAPINGTDYEITSTATDNLTDCYCTKHEGKLLSWSG